MDGYDLPDIDMEEVKDGKNIQSKKSGGHQNTEDDVKNSSENIRTIKARRFEETFINAKDWEEDKEPFRGFDQGKSEGLLDQLEQESVILYQLVRELENEDILKAVATITTANKGGPVPIPPELLDVPPEFTPKLTVIRAPGQDKTMQEIMDDLHKPFAAGWKRELIYKCVSDTKADVVQYLSPDGTELKNMQEIMDYLENIYGISDADGGLGKYNFSFHKTPLTNLGYDKGEYIYVVDKSGKKRLVNLRRKTVTASQASVDSQAVAYNGNDSLSPQLKRGVSLKHREETLRQPGMVMSNRSRSLNAAKMQQQFKPGAATRLDSNLAAMIRRQRLQGDNLRVPGATRNEDSAMITISAIRQPNNAAHASGMQGHRGQIRRERDFDAQNQFGDNMEREDEVLPCSITCPGMAGRVPNLQCQSCLCLYHGACLGFPPNAKFANFICPNCDAKQDLAPPSNKISRGSNVATHMRQRPMAKPMNQQPIMNPMMTRRIGQTVISPAGMSVKRVEIKPPELPLTRSRVTGHPLGGKPTPPKKGLWPSGKYVPPPPPLSGGKSVTITPMGKIPKGRAPPLPTLRPMLPNSSNTLSPPVLPGRPSFNLRGMPKLVRAAGGPRAMVPLPDLNKKRLSQAPVSKANIQRSVTGTTQEKRIMTKQWAASTGQYRCYPQAIVSIGNNKFIAMPHGHTDNNKNQMDVESTTVPETTEKPVDNCHDLEEEVKPLSPEAEAFVLQQIFPYLSVRDLLSVSCVSHSWNKAASNNELWKTVRMKNAHIFDFDGFVNLLSQRATEVLDLRKMAYESQMNWNALADGLSQISSLKRVIIGPRSSTPDLIEMLSNRCPNIEVVTQ